MNKLNIRTKERLMDTAPSLYGIFLEDINRAVDGGLYPELLRNRTFEDSVIPADCSPVADKEGKDPCYAFISDTGWRDEFNHGEGLSKWVRENGIPETDVPAWYADGASFSLDYERKLNPRRQVSLKAVFGRGGKIVNTGFCGVPQEAGAEYCLRIFAAGSFALKFCVRSGDGSKANRIGSLSGDEGTPAGELMSLCPEGVDSSFRFSELKFKAEESFYDGVLEIEAPEECTVSIGYISLLPAETFKGHGLRKDIAEKLAGLHPGFFRFPGGCIVEGFTRQTIMTMKKTVGPVWERPGHQLMWHYRSYNAVGFHEYLQFCEDLDMEPIWVCNCGMTCQARKEIYLEGAEQDEILEDCMNAIEYARGGEDTPWGALRAKMGHPAPFRLGIIEIGNENWGPEYETRYRRWYDAIKEKYPDMVLIANSHLEEKGLPAEIVDEHYYDTAEWFAEHTELFDARDRRGPKLFLGETAVVRGYTAQLYGAVAEGAFFTGVEKNQDVVKLVSYAPLLENVNFKSWFPNLIRFDNHRSMAIPSYYVWKMFGEHRGDYVVGTGTDTGVMPRPVKGVLAVYSRIGTRMSAPLFNGKPLPLSHEVLGHFSSPEDSEESAFYTISAADEAQQHEAMKVHLRERSESLLVFGEEEPAAGRLEFDLETKDGESYDFGFFPYRLPPIEYISDETDPPAEWNVENVRSFRFKVGPEGSRIIDEMGSHPGHPSVVSETAETPGPAGVHHIVFETDLTRMKISADGRVLHDLAIPANPVIAASAAVGAAAGGTGEKELVIKLVNLSDREEDTEITLDCEVEEDYSVITVTGEREDRNTLDEPERIRDVRRECTGAAGSFVFRACPRSANVLLLRRKA